MKSKLISRRAFEPVYATLANVIRQRREARRLSLNPLAD
jgi:hypothetical protein